MISAWVRARQKFPFLGTKQLVFQETSQLTGNISIKKIWRHANFGLVYETRRKHKWNKASR